MARIRYLEAFLYPLRSPRRFLRIGFEIVTANIKAFVTFAFLMTCLLGIEHLTHSSRSPWVEVRHSWSLLTLSLLACALSLLHLYCSLSTAIRSAGYWLRAVRESADGAQALPTPGPPPKGAWKTVPLGLVFLAPDLFVIGLGAWAVQRALGAAYQSSTDLSAQMMVWLGSGVGLLTLVLAAVVAILSALIGNLSALRLATIGRLRSALNPASLWRDLRCA